MLDKLGAVGIVGLLLIVAGIAAIASHNPIVAGGLLLVLAGLGLVLKGVVSSVLESFGMGGAL